MSSLIKINKYSLVHIRNAGGYRNHNRSSLTLMKLHLHLTPISPPEQVEFREPTLITRGERF